MWKSIKEYRKKLEERKSIVADIERCMCDDEDDDDDSPVIKMKPLSIDDDLESRFILTLNYPLHMRLKADGF